MNLRPFLAVLIVTVATAHAEDREPRNNVVALSVEVEKTLPNDTLSASFYVEDTDSNPVKLADRINKSLNQALAKGRNAHAIKLSSGRQQTWPVYSGGEFSSTASKQHLDGWRTRAYIELESHDFGAAQLLIADLQSSMILERINFGIAPETRHQGENSLIGDALAAFRERADLVRQGLAGKSYKIVDIQMNNGNATPRERTYGVGAAPNVSSVLAPATQEFVAGESTLNMQVSGEIQIEP